jgi:cysteinyl-tRNA synthetase
MRYLFALILAVAAGIGAAAAQETPKNLLMLDTGGHMALIRSIAFTPDGRQLVSASDDKTIRVWDLATGRTVRTIRGESAPGHPGDAATGQPFVRTWLHCAHLRMSGAKMAKRSGNFSRPGDIYARGFGPGALRYALLATHYRSPLDFSERSLTAAAAAVERLNTAVVALDAYTEERADDASLPSVLGEARAAFAAALEDDLNISEALAALFDLVRELNARVAARSLSSADARAGAAAVRELDRVVGVIDDETDDLEATSVAMLEARAEARAARDWARSDELRDALAAGGITVEDTPDGQRWRRS